MGRRITLTFRLPEKSDLLRTVQFVRTVRDFIFTPPGVALTEAPESALRRFSTSLVMLSLGMAFTLYIGGGDANPFLSNPLVRGSIWRIVYAIIFLIAGTVELLRLALEQRISKRNDSYLRMVSFTLAIVGALGWALIGIYAAGWYGGDWTLPVPWIFILFYFARAYRTYTVYIDQGTLDEIRSKIP